MDLCGARRGGEREQGGCAAAREEAAAAGRTETILVNLSGRGDKDMETAARWFNLLDELDGEVTA